MTILIFYMLLDRKMKKYTEPLTEAKNPCCMHLFLHEHTQATILSNTILRFIFILLIIKVQVTCRIVTKNILGTSKMTADMERKTFSSICYTDFKSNPIVRSLKMKLGCLMNQLTILSGTNSINQIKPQHSQCWALGVVYNYGWIS